MLGKELEQGPWPSFVLGTTPWLTASARVERCTLWPEGLQVESVFQLRFVACSDASDGASGMVLYRFPKLLFRQLFMQLGL